MVSPKIFRSRWSALLWAAGILWTAYDVAESTRHADPPAGNSSAPSTAAGEDVTGTPVSSADIAVLANAMGK